MKLAERQRKEHEMAAQQKVNQAETMVQMVELISVPPLEIEEGMSKEQDMPRKNEGEEHTIVDPQLKRLQGQDEPTAQKKTRITKISEGASLDNGEWPPNAARGSLAELMTEQTTVLGVLRAQLQALQVQPLGGMTPHLIEYATEVEQMMRTYTTHTLVLPDNTIFTKVEGDIQG